MQDIVKLQIGQFALIYTLLIIVLIIMKKSKVNQSKLLIVASVRMTVQLMIAGWILTYIFDHPHPIFTITYFAVMMIFAIYRVLSKNKDINKRFKIAIITSMALPGMAIVVFFVTVVVRENVFNPQYVIPLSGMIIGNEMTGVSLGVKNFREGFDGQRNKVETLLNIGVAPRKILLPFANKALETALIPTLNSMLGMGIVSLPGMMTGQILSGTVPTTAILYQISIMIAICTVVCISVFGSLYIGCRSMYNKYGQIDI